MTEFSLKNISANLAVYGIMHAMIDATCAAIFFSIMGNRIIGASELIYFAIFYNILAFALQAGLGPIVDYFKAPRVAAIAGCILAVISTMSYTYFPLAAIFFAGVGNSLFHLGGGSISLNLTPKKAVAPGIFVAPGALGLLAGTLLGKSGKFIAWPFILTLVILCLLMLAIKKPPINYQKAKVAKDKIKYFWAILLLVFLAITIRSLIGFVVVFPWKTDINLLIILTLAVALGKGLGGIIADKFGWIKIAVGTLILSMPLLAFGTGNFYLGIIGMFLFNVTMPVTLVAISNILPGQPAFAFGLTCLALILGAVPAFIGLNWIFNQYYIILAIIYVSAAALFSGLKLLLNINIFSYNKEGTNLT